MIGGDYTIAQKIGAVLLAPLLLLVVIPVIALLASFLCGVLSRSSIAFWGWVVGICGVMVGVYSIRDWILEPFEDLFFDDLDD